MGRHHLLTGIFATAMLANSAAGQSVKSTVTASNGVAVTVYTDEFAARKEFSAPAVKLPDGQILVATVSSGGVAKPVELTGFFVYSGEWRRYNRAIFKGGDPASFVSTGREVGRCSSSRYSRPSCILNENFTIALTPAEIRSREEAGVIPIQIRAEDTSTVIAQIPVSYIKAVAEVAGVNIDPPAPPVVVAPPAIKPPAARRPAPTRRRR